MGLGRDLLHLLGNLAEGELAPVGHKRLHGEGDLTLFPVSLDHHGLEPVPERKVCAQLGLVDRDVLALLLHLR